jgi:hypothetical protein
MHVMSIGILSYLTMRFVSVPAHKGANINRVAILRFLLSSFVV